MEQSPTLEPKSSSASQEIARIRFNPKVHYRIRKFPPQRVGTFLHRFQLACSYVHTVYLSTLKLEVKFFPRHYGVTYYQQRTKSSNRTLTSVLKEHSSNLAHLDCITRELSHTGA